MYFKDASGNFNIVNQTGGMLVYIPPSFRYIYIYFLVLIGTRTGIRFFILYIVGSKANFHLATIFPVAIKSNPSLLVSV